MMKILLIISIIVFAFSLVYRRGMSLMCKYNKKELFANYKTYSIIANINAFTIAISFILSVTLFILLTIK